MRVVLFCYFNENIHTDTEPDLDMVEQSTEYMAMRKLIRASGIFEKWDNCTADKNFDGEQMCSDLNNLEAISARNRNIKACP